ncbi:hypothetical protein POM88_022773 [Heracleum sosnowskyi]|uniref:beta-galactosidase n=1 Tax=Heracleum sosnowskyi TaxID=360622 RepID=A0AAD8MV47_9APIA|nr:hypothetical protein POM88_022773 [Heracleum sosnowskyi]
MPWKSRKASVNFLAVVALYPAFNFSSNCVKLNTNADNGPFKVEMQRFTKRIVNMMKSNSLFEPQGGPIIMSQIENEYGPIEWEIGAPGKSYTKWFSSSCANKKMSLIQL